MPYERSITSQGERNKSRRRTVHKDVGKERHPQPGHGGGQTLVKRHDEAAGYANNFLVP